MGAEELEDAEDRNAPKDALSQLLLDVEGSGLAVKAPEDTDEKALTALRDGLGVLKISALKKRVVAAGVGAEELEDA